MISRECRKALQEERRQALARYERHRRRNALARPGVHELVIVLDHLKAGFNVPKVLRSADAFGVHEVHLIAIGPFDPAPAKGGLKHVPARFYDDFAASYADLAGRGYTLFVLDPAAEQALFEADLPDRSAFVLGHEEHGVSFDPADYPDLRALRIPQFGQVQSLNVSVAASIVMYEYARRRAQGARSHHPPELT
jgi:tRNA G18 (ribose-2'-O)-methylase SpoU